jgi:hemolysin III
MTHVHRVNVVRPALVTVMRPAVPAKPTWRGWLHLVWFEASLVVGTVMIVGAPANERAVTTVYATAVCCLFGTSALYHRGAWGPATRRSLQRLDHAMIFVLIAGSATPIVVVAERGPLLGVLLIGMWSLTAVALVIHLVWVQAPERLVGATYVGLGCLGIAALPAVWTNAGPTACLLIAFGGALYIAGAVMYHRRRPDPWPTVFGYHEVFHAFVCAGATLHYIAIAWLIF